MAVRRALLAVLCALAVFTPASPASAHGAAGSTDYRTELTDVTGSLDGVELHVRNLGAKLELVRTTAKEVIVLGYEGEPYLRLDAEGVSRNINSPATYLNQDRYARVSLPANADADAAPVWERISTADRFTWHDHRAHFMGTQAPPIATEQPDVEHVVYTDTIRLTIDGRDVGVGTRIVWVPRPAQTSWLIGVGVAAAVAIAAVVLRPRTMYWLGVAAPLLAFVTRPLGVAWLALPALGVVLGAGALARRLAWLAGLAGLAAVVTGALRLDVFEHSLVPGSLDPTLQRVALVLALGSGAGAIVGAITAPAPRKVRPSAPSPAG